MRRRYLLVLTLIVLIAALSVIYYLTLSTPLLKYIEPQNQENGTSTPSILPFKLPWETKNTTTKNSGGAGGAAGSGSSGSGSGSGGTENNEGSEIINAPRVYHQISADSVPEGLKIFVSYYVNDSLHFQTSTAPFDLGADDGTPACFLLSSIVNNGTLNWKVDGQECQFSVCEGSSSNRTGTVSSGYGCLVTMDTNHSVTLQYTPNQ